MLNLPYQKLQIWQKAVHLAEQAYAMTRNFPEEEKFGLISQIRRAGVSIPSNIAEGSQRGTNKDFKNFIFIARGSLAELETQFILAKSFGFISETDLNSIYALTIE